MVRAPDAREMIPSVFTERALEGRLEQRGPCTLRVKRHRTEGQVPGRLDGDRIVDALKFLGNVHNLRVVRDDLGLATYLLLIPLRAAARERSGPSAAVAAAAPLNRERREKPPPGLAPVMDVRFDCSRCLLLIWDSSYNALLDCRASAARAVGTVPHRPSIRGA